MLLPRNSAMLDNGLFPVRKLGSVRAKARLPTQLQARAMMIVEVDRSGFLRLSVGIVGREVGAGT
jgi:hypothetical protein